MHYSLKSPSSFQIVSRWLNSALHYNNSIDFGGHSINKVTVPITLMKLHCQDKNQVSFSQMFFSFSLFRTLIVDFHIPQCWIFLSIQLREVSKFPLPVASPFPLKCTGSLDNWWVWGSVLLRKFRSWGICFYQIHFSSVMNSLRQGTFQTDFYVPLQHKPHFNTQLLSHWDCVLYIGLKDIRDIFLFSLTWH